MIILLSALSKFAQRSEETSGAPVVAYLRSGGSDDCSIGTVCASSPAGHYPVRRAIMDVFRTQCMDPTPEVKAVFSALHELTLSA